MGWRVAAAEKNSIKGVISPDTDLKKNRRIAPKRELSCGLRLLERGKKNRGILTGRSKTVLWKQSLSSYGIADSLLALK